jgi:hypothetical protein
MKNKVTSKIVSALLIVAIGAGASYYITKIANESSELAIEKYFNSSLLFFGIVLVAMFIAGIISKKVCK